MDAIDARLVTLLQANARLTYQELGDGVGLSAPAAFQRVRRLEERGVIEGYHARVAPGAVGRGRVVLLLVEPLPGSDAKELLGTWEQAQGVIECHRTVGGAYWLKLRVSHLEDLEPHVHAAREAGCTVRVEVVSRTAFERWMVPVGSR